MTIEELKIKAAIRQAAIELCQQHFWDIDYKSQITSGGSAVCVRCGERRDWDAIPQRDPRTYDTERRSGKEMNDR